ncbi:hypothetical protein EVAR_48389_1 [Eumeta japonica]|uniref:Protein kinase domain-containing protein n=1 Tax=Eumeta variegata TaxID=151549 RepID=A0A4C1ZCG8_EUMVA|nr:hypothetical protein EVAR_48389_1 [Eumeta japonica]
MRAGARASAVGNYVLTGRALGKGHFARVEEATHSLLHHKVAIKVIDLTCIREEYARRNLHREPQLMARLGHPCIAALYETMMASRRRPAAAHTLRLHMRLLQTNPLLINNSFRCNFVIT